MKIIILTLITLITLTTANAGCRVRQILKIFSCSESTDGQIKNMTYEGSGSCALRLHFKINDKFIGESTDRRIPYNDRIWLRKETTKLVKNDFYSGSFETYQ